MTRPSNLPEFEHPPVVEVAAGVQFAPIRGWSQAHVGALWTKLRRDYPKVADHPPLPRNALVAAEPRNSIQIEFSDRIIPPRAWFISENEQRLVQVQADRLIHNWRGAGDAYPRFETLREHFSTVLDQFLAVVAEEDFPPIRLEQVELTYVNRIESSIDRVLQGARPVMPSVATRNLGGHLATTYALVNVPNSFLNVEAVQGDAALGVLLTLVFRADLQQGTPQDALATLSSGRRAIVQAFAEVTSTELRDQWGQR